MEDLRKYTRKSELYKLSAEEQTEKMKLVMKEVEKISAYTGVSEEAAYNLFLNRRGLIRLQEYSFALMNLTRRRYGCVG